MILSSCDNNYLQNLINTEEHKLPSVKEQLIWHKKRLILIEAYKLMEHTTEQLLAAQNNCMFNGDISNLYFAGAKIYEINYEYHFI